MKILCVHSEPIFLEGLFVKLRSLGHTSVAVSTISEAIDQLSATELMNEEFDLFIIGPNFERFGDGADFAGYLAKNHKVIMCSMYAQHRREGVVFFRLTNDDLERAIAEAMGNQPVPPTAA
jgi:hypothetical protein